MSGQLLISHSDSEYPYQDSEPDPATRSHIHEAGYKSQNHLYLPLPLLPFYRLPEQQPLHRGSPSLSMQCDCLRSQYFYLQHPAQLSLYHTLFSAPLPGEQRPMPAGDAFLPPDAVLPVPE